MHYNEHTIQEVIDQMADELRTYIQEHDITHPLMIGIHTAGVWLAQALHKKMALQEELGELNNNFYRDDFNRIGLHPQIKPSKLPFSLEDRHIILVDDVLYTGRTIRGAMNELFDYGRPASIVLAVLFERDGRELPIEAQIVGIRKKLEVNEYIKLSGPDKLELSIVTKDD